MYFIITLGGVIMKNISVYDIAKWFFDNNESVRMRTFDGNAKLQKLIYYAQAMYSAVYGKPLFQEKIQAWANGPVVREVYDSKKRNDFDNMPSAELDDDVVRVLQVVNSIYGVLTTEELIKQTHEEKPWNELKEYAEQKLNPEIDFEVIKEFYKDLKDVYDAFEGYDFDGEVVETINGNNFCYNKNDLQLDDEDLFYLYQIGMKEKNKTFNVIKKDGKLVLY